MNHCLCVCGLINARKHSAPNEWGVARTLNAIAVSAILANCTATAQHRYIYDLRANPPTNNVKNDETLRTESELEFDTRSRISIN